MATKHRTFRTDDEIWDEFGTATKLMGTDRTAALIEFMRWVTHQPGARSPQRPSKAAMRGKHGTPASSAESPGDLI